MYISTIVVNEVHFFNNMKEFMPRLDVGGVEAETFGSAEVIFRVVEKDGFVGHDAECA